MLPSRDGFHLKRSGNKFLDKYLGEIVSHGDETKERSSYKHLFGC